MLGETGRARFKTRESQGVHQKPHFPSIIFFTRLFQQSFPHMGKQYKLSFSEIKWESGVLPGGPAVLPMQAARDPRAATKRSCLRPLTPSPAKQIHFALKKKKMREGIPWRSSSKDSVLSLLWAWVQSLVGELRSHGSCALAKKKKKKITGVGEDLTLPLRRLHICIFTHIHLAAKPISHFLQELISPRFRARGVKLCPRPLNPRCVGAYSPAHQLLH